MKIKSVEKETPSLTSTFLFFCGIMGVALGILGFFVISNAIHSYEVVEEYYVEGRIRDVRYSAGGFTHPDLTTIIFDDNRTLIIRELVEGLEIGKTYRFFFYKTRNGKVFFKGVEESGKNE